MPPCGLLVVVKSVVKLIAIAYDIIFILDSFDGASYFAVYHILIVEIGYGPVTFPVNAVLNFKRVAVTFKNWYLRMLVAGVS